VNPLNPSQPLIDELRHQAQEWALFAMQCASKGFDGMATACVQNSERCEKCAEDIERANQ
jgi:hypothetical protein